MKDQLALLPFYLKSHLDLTLLALFIGVLISVPSGVLATRYKWLKRISFGLAGVIQTVPGIALLALMVPLLAFLKLPSIGFLPALIALILYSLLPILRNTVVGIQSVDESYIEAAKGVGMTDFQRLIKVELPLAQPMIMAGVRTATVWTVGMATLATPVGATSLGNFIFIGLQTRNLDAILIGCISAALLAILLDGSVRFLEESYLSKSRVKSFAGYALLLLYFTYLMFFGASYLFGQENRPIVIAGKSLTEGYVLGEMIAEQIRRETGDIVEVAPSMSSVIAFESLLNGDVDAYVEYTGTLWMHHMSRENPPRSSQEALYEIKKFLSEKKIHILGAVGFDNMFALAIKKELSRKKKIETLSDLSKYSKLSIGGEYEFFGRPEWRLYRDGYGLKFSKQLAMEHLLMYQAVNEGALDVAVVYTTDGQIEANNLVILDDDKNIGISYEALILASEKFEQKNSKAVSAIKKLVGSIDEDQMRKLNYKVDSEGQSPRKVARDFLNKK